MHKDELISLHQMLVEIKEYLQQNMENADFTEYDNLKISPSQAHKSKMEHKYAIFVLGNAVANAMKDVDYSASGRMASRMRELAKKTLKEIEYSAQ